MSNPTELPDLAACPFCGSDYVDLIHNASSIHRYDWHFAVECECGARGESGKSDEFAVKAWNRRAQPEGEAPQAEPIANIPLRTGGAMRQEARYGGDGHVWLLYGSEGELIRALSHNEYEIVESVLAATLSSLCGAQLDGGHGEGKAHG